MLEVESMPCCNSASEISSGPPTLSSLQRAVELTLFTLPKGLLVYHALLARRGWVPADFPGASVVIFALAIAVMAATDRQVRR